MSQSAKPKHAPGFLARVNSAKAKVKETTIEKVSARLKNGEKLLCRLKNQNE